MFYDCVGFSGFPPSKADAHRSGGLQSELRGGGAGHYGHGHLGR